MQINKFELSQKLIIGYPTIPVARQHDLNHVFIGLGAKRAIFGP
jgi:hypothetical protein